MEAAEELENAGGLKGSSCRGLEEEDQAGGFRQLEARFGLCSGTLVIPPFLFYLILDMWSLC